MIFSERHPTCPCVSQLTAGPSRPSGEKSVSLGFEKTSEVGPKVLQCLLEVVPLCSKSVGRGGSLGLFRLPTSRQVLRNFTSWPLAVCVALNCMWGGSVFSEQDVMSCQFGCLKNLVKEVVRLKEVSGPFGSFCWDEFVRTVDYEGDEVKAACRFAWKNISSPREIGKVPLVGICTLGAKDYVENFDL